MQVVRPIALSLYVLLLASCGSDTAGPQPNPRQGGGGTANVLDAGGADDVGGPEPDASCVGSITQGCEPGPTGDAGGPEPDAAADAGGAGDDDGLGFYAGNYIFGDYALLTERDFPGEDAATLFGADCAPLARIPQEYADVVCESLQARLDTGATFDRADGPCSCGSSCTNPMGEETCWEPLDQATYPWGYLLPERPFEPLRSLGTFNPNFSLGEVVYIPKWDGIDVPSIAGAGGFVHDGCFVVDFWAGDSFSSMEIFYGPFKMQEYFLTFFGPDIDGDVYRFSPKCAGR